MGEFEKRFKDTRFPVAVMIMELIEEAKKEYPIWDNSDPNSRLSGDVLLDLVKAKDKWFKKWFDNVEA